MLNFFHTKTHATCMHQKMHTVQCFKSFLMLGCGTNPNLLSQGCARDGVPAGKDCHSLFAQQTGS